MHKFQAGDIVRVIQDNENYFRIPEDTKHYYADSHLNKIYKIARIWPYPLQSGDFGIYEIHLEDINEEIWFNEEHLELVFTS